MTKQNRNSYISILVHRQISGRTATDWKNFKDFEEDIVFNLEESETFSPNEYVYLSECLVKYWKQISNHNARMRQPTVTLEAGTVGKDVWIGAPSECYEEASKALTQRRLHILRFTLAQAESVIEMLRMEIDRQRGSLH